MGRRRIVVLWSLLLSGLLCPATSGGQPNVPMLSSLDSPDAVETLTRVFAPHLLGIKLDRPQPRQHCGVEITDMVAANWPLLSPELRAHIPDHFRPLEFRSKSAHSTQDTDVCDAFLDSEHFRVHYSTDPQHQPPGYPDLQTVRDLAAHLETAYLYHRDVSGMGVPLTDGQYGGGTDLYDCYFFDIDDGLLGQMRGRGRVDTECDFTWWGIILIATDFGVLEFESQLKLTSEHEYYHLLQYAHNGGQRSWIKESTARNSEFQVWPEIAVPRGIGGWMQQPYLPLWSTVGLREYAPHMWFYLEAHYGHDFVTRMWNSTCQSLAEDYITDELEANGTSWNDMLLDFAVWNYFSGWRDDGRHYDPGLGVQAVHYQAAHGDFPVPARALFPQQMAQTTGSNYIRFNGPPEADGLKIVIDGHPALSPDRVVTVLAVNEWGHRVWTMSPNDDGDVDFTVPSWGLYEHVALVVTNLWEASRDSSEIHYTYAAEVVGLPVDIETQSHLVASLPNPFTDQTRVVYFTPREGARTTIRIFDLRGRLVRTLNDESTFAGNHQVVWDGNNQRGERVASGMYFVRLDNGAYQDVRKVMFLR